MKHPPAPLNLLQAIRRLDVEYDQKCMLFILAAWGFEHGEMKGENLSPGVRLLANEMGIVPRQAKRIRQSLIEKKFLKPMQRDGKVVKRSYFTLYRLIIPGVTRGWEDEQTPDQVPQEAPLTAEDLAFFRQLKRDQRAGQMPRRLFIQEGVRRGFAREGMEALYALSYEEFERVEALERVRVPV